MPTAHLLSNPAAGRLQPPFLVRRAARVLEESGWQVEIKPTRSGQHLAELARLAASQGIDAVFIAGGDGSIEKSLAGLVGSKTALGVLPSGTANVWAHEIGLPAASWLHWDALERSAHRLAHADTRCVDIGLCNGVPYLLWAGVGLDAIIVHSVEPRKRWKRYFGAVQYAGSALMSAGTWRGVDLQIQVDDRTINGRFLIAVMSNIRHYAGGIALLSPQARLDDGRMELWLFSGDTLVDALRHGWDLLTGNHQKSVRVQRYLFRQLTLESDSPLYVQLDGEPLDAGDRIHVEVKPKALRALIPAQAPATLFEPEDGAVHPVRGVFDDPEADR